MTTSRIAAAAIAFAACSSGHEKHIMTQAEMIAADPLPLARGAKWTYDVTLKKLDLDSNRETVKKLSWTTEVVDAQEHDGVMAYRVRGWPSDLAEDTAAPTEKTLLRRGNAFLWSGPEGGLDGASGWFSWPVMDGQKICPASESTYCWQVAAIEGGYALSYHAGADEQRFELEPGTGVARFHFHGTANDVDAKLVAYNPGK